MPLTIYAIAAAAVAALLMFGTIKVQHANNERLASERDHAVQANKDLADDCRVKIEKLAGDIRTISAASVRRQKDAKAKLAEVDKTAAAQREVIDKLIRESESAPTSPANCAAAETTLRKLAQDRQ